MKLFALILSAVLASPLGNPAGNRVRRQDEIADADYIDYDYDGPGDGSRGRFYIRSKPR